MGLTATARRRAEEGDTLKYFVEDPGTGTLYKRGQLLGQGAFGQCYKFTDTCSHRVYAVKVISQQRVARLGNQGKVQREIELHSQLHHRNVVGFHRHFADQENIYLVLEYCSRKSLADILKVRRRLTEAEVRFYLKQITSGLQYLHQQGVIHRDLKLSNVFITQRMQVKIGDLGLAMREEAQPSGRRRGGVCGTPNYLAPEVIAKKGHSSRSDVWALGCIMYTTLAGFPPFEATPKQELFQRIREGCYLLPAHLSPAARSLIGGLLSPDPSGRPSLEDMLGHPFFAQHPTLARLPSRTCRAAPVFPLANPLGKFFQKAARLFLRGSPGRDPQADATLGPPAQCWRAWNEGCAAACRHICYHSEVGKAESFGCREVLHFFTQYMQRRLQEVNFYHDHTKTLLSRSAEDLLTFVDRQRCSTAFPLGTLAQQGWTLPLCECAHYALHLLSCL